MLQARKSWKRFAGTVDTYADAGSTPGADGAASPSACLFAQIALEHDLPLLHDDADYERLKTVEPRLRFDGA
ncbi:hypothetical protein [Acidithiobacillus sulfuriphilus]|uniref:Uncharacterized protein n=1 Tax=Acidithiobacillus sulfuriphilus TaxID=1867749 RepID=A0ACD5HP09_9PROT|nr:hypothetical protein [Acidithiobacillus sulfuriphilus]